MEKIDVIVKVPSIFVDIKKYFKELSSQEDRLNRNNKSLTRILKDNRFSKEDYLKIKEFYENQPIMNKWLVWHDSEGLAGIMLDPDSMV